MHARMMRAKLVPFQCTGWTQSPGLEMEQGTGELAGSRVLTLTGSRLEFVINNSEGGWCAQCSLL